MNEAMMILGLLGAPVVADDALYVDNVVIVLDGSGSMEQKMRSAGVPKMKAAKAALHAVLGQLPETTHVGLLVFSAGIAQPWAHPLGPRSTADMKRSIDSVSAGGSTPLGAYMKIGADRLLEKRARQFGYGSYRLLIVTDGEASDRKLVEQHTPEIVGRGITVDVIGVDMQKSHTLATKVHSYRRADNPQTLQTAIAEVFAEVSTEDTGAGAGGDAFEAISPLSHEMAAAILSVLGKHVNEPIGGSAAVKQAAQPRSGAARRQTQGQQPSQPPTTDSQSNTNGDTGSGFFACCFVLFVIVVIVSIAIRRIKAR